MSINLEYPQGAQQAWARELLMCGAIRREVTASHDTRPSSLTINTDLIPNALLKELAKAFVEKIRSKPAPCSPVLMIDALAGLEGGYALATKVQEAYSQRVGLRVPELLQLVREGSKVIISDGIMAQTLPRSSSVTLFLPSFMMDTMTTVSAIEKLGYRIASLAFLVGPTAGADFNKSCKYRCDSLFHEDQFPVTAV